MKGSLSHIRSSGPLSEREKVWPGTIERMTGAMAMCEECCRNYRRMSENQDICGTFTKPTVVSPGAIPYARYVPPPGR
jgi:hypothetical protein